MARPKGFSLPTVHCLLPAVRRGYVFLVSVLVIGAIATTTAVSLVLLGLSSELSGLSVSHSAQAYELAHTCAERTIRSLRADPAYAGNETFAIGTGSCRIEEIGGTGAMNRSICVEGRSGNIFKRMQVHVRTLYPSVTIAEWREVITYSLCD